jgi:hypothetical protein
MSDTVVFAISTAVMAALFLSFLIWREEKHAKQVDCLTSKIMARNYVEFATYRSEEIAKKPETLEPEKPRVVNDPVLGRVF